MKAAGLVAAVLAPHLAPTAVWADVTTTPGRPGATVAVGVLTLPTSVEGNGSDAVDAWAMAYDRAGDWFQVGWIANPDGPLQWFSESELAGQPPIDTYAPMPWPGGDTVNVWISDDSGRWTASVLGPDGWSDLSSVTLPMDASSVTWEAAVETDTFGNGPQPSYTLGDGGAPLVTPYGG